MWARSQSLGWSPQNLNCPHCRVDLSPSVPFVPNIVIEQIVERKLNALPDSGDKSEMLQERQDKIA
jgi:hypothetical protein